MTNMIKCSENYLSGKCVALIKAKTTVLKIIEKTHLQLNQQNKKNQQYQDQMDFFQKNLKHEQEQLAARKQESEDWADVHIISGKIQYIDGECFFIAVNRSGGTIK